MDSPTKATVLVGSPHVKVPEVNDLQCWSGLWLVALLCREAVVGLCIRS